MIILGVQPGGRAHPPKGCSSPRGINGGWLLGATEDDATFGGGIYNVSSDESPEDPMDRFEKSDVYLKVVIVEIV